MKADIAQKLIQLTTQGYNEIAQLFSQTRQYSWKDFNIFKKYIQRIQNEYGDVNIFDIGCGNGRLNNFLSQYHFTYTGLDISQHLLSEAQKIYPNETFIQKDFLEYKNSDSFDIIFAIAMLNHIPSDELRCKALQKMYDLLKPGGYVCMTNWNLWHLSLKKKSVFKFKLQKKERKQTQRYLNEHNIPVSELGIKDMITIWKSGKVKVPLYYYAFTRNEIKKIAEKVGFKVIENKYSHKKWYKGGNIITVLQK